MTGVAVVDVGLSNLDSMVRALRRLGAQVYVVSDKDGMGAPHQVVLPGVGTYDVAMSRLEQRGLSLALTALAFDDVPLLGVCLGMQVLTTEGDEGGPRRGLGLIPGHTRAIVATSELERVPHVGWNSVHPVRSSALFTGIPDGTDFYFVHGYQVQPDNPQLVVAVTPYAGNMCSAVATGSVLGVQFHPEKSQAAGLAVLENFLGM